MPASSLTEQDLDPDPFRQFTVWFDAARAAGQVEPEAMALATATPDGMPSARFVLMRQFDQRGLVFFTNERSRKGLEMAANPVAAAVFRWKAVERQVRASGTVAPIEPAESDAYFASRDRGSQLGAWASDQSQVLGARAELDRRLEEVTGRFGAGEVTRPPWWGGYRLAPTEFEFWQQGRNRLHDRFRYRLTDGRWRIERLNP